MSWQVVVASTRKYGELQLPQLVTEALRQVAQASEQEAQMFLVASG